MEVLSDMDPIPECIATCDIQQAQENNHAPILFNCSKNITVLQAKQLVCGSTVYAYG